MGLVIKRVVIPIAFITAVTILLILIYNKIIPSCSLERDIFMLQSDSGRLKYNQTDSNKMDCDLATFSMLCRSMCADGFNVDKLLEVNDGIDVILSRGDIRYRMLYKLDGTFVTISNCYEKSYVPLTYIFE